MPNVSRLSRAVAPVTVTDKPLLGQFLTYRFAYMMQFHGRYLHSIVLAVIIGSILATSYVSATSSSSSPPKVIWTTNPITITFSHTTGHGSTTDSFKCAPPVSGAIVVTNSVPTPAGATLSVTPASFPSCGPSFSDTITLNAVSTTKGTYHAVVSISQLSLYQSIPPGLTVIIVVT